MHTLACFYPSHCAPALVALVALALSPIVSGRAYAQAVAPAPAPAKPVAVPTPAQAAGEVVELSAFEVQADKDNSYGALNSASITRFNVEMDKLPVSADIFTETFMKDIAATSVEDVVQGYSVGAGYGDGCAGRSPRRCRASGRPGAGGWSSFGKGPR